MFLSRASVKLEDRIERIGARKIAVSMRSKYFIEATQMPGKGKLKLTGKLGEVMQESAQIAISLVKAGAEELGLESPLFSDSDLHIHVPNGAIPKDGPSAGVTLYTALISLLKDIKVRGDVAMTGEITLRGLVLPVGGIKEKVLAALRAGVKEVILPAKNEKDLFDVPKEVQDKLKFHFVSRVDEVLQIALEKKIRKKKKKAGSGYARRTTKTVN